MINGEVACLAESRSPAEVGSASLTSEPPVPLKQGPGAWVAVINGGAGSGDVSLASVTVLARRGRRGGQPGPEQSTWEPREGTGLAALPQGKVHPRQQLPSQRDRRGRPPTRQRSGPPTGRGSRHDCHQLARNSGQTERWLSWQRGRRGLGHPPEGEGPGAAGPLGRTERWRGVDVPTSTQVK